MTGGELVSSYAVDFRARYGGAEAIVISGYANEMPAYLPSDDLLCRPASYAAGTDQDNPDLAAESMAVYGHIAHFDMSAPGAPVDGVDQIVRSTLDAMLRAPRAREIAPR